MKVIIRGYRWIGFLLPIIYSRINQLEVFTFTNILLSIVMSYLWLPFIIAYWIVKIGIY